MIRALLDPNIFISYLLKPNHDSPPCVVVEAAISRVFVPIVPISVIVEFVSAVSAKPYLRDRISRRQMEILVHELLLACERPTPLEEFVESVSRDSKDDYLFTYAVLEETDYLVSGDRDILALRDVSPVKIVTPAEFAAILSGLPEDLSLIHI